MKFFEPSLSPRFSELLTQREADLRATLRATGDTAEQTVTPDREVTDFVDIADADTQDDVDEVQAQHAAVELEQVLSARKRLEDGTYGQCMQCGKPIDLRRLTLMPATPYCVDCQSAHERPGHGRPSA